MFDLLKKKLSSFAEKLKGQIEKKEAESTGQTAQVTAEEKIIEVPKAETVSEPAQIQEKYAPKSDLDSELEEELAEFQEPETEKPKIKPETSKIDSEVKKIEEEEPSQQEITEKKPAAKPFLPFFRPKEEERELKAKPTLKTQLLSAFSREIRIEEKDISGFLDELELELLESDVEQNTALEIISIMRRELVGKKFSKSDDLTSCLKSEIKNAMEKVMEAPKIDLFQEMSRKKPYVILFLGPNGAGKTTTIAKLTQFMQNKGKKVILAAADTFRAASIEQLELHAHRLGTRIVKHDYGSDPTAVAFDAVKAAQAGGYDLVLIDSAGRQETNMNLVNELKKMDRVIKPDLKIFIGEALAGKSLLNQVMEFNKEIGLNGFILSKIDTDAKGGTAISLLHNLHKPILFVGTGQEYKDLAEFSPRFILDRILPEENAR